MGRAGGLQGDSEKMRGMNMERKRFGLLARFLFFFLLSDEYSHPSSKSIISTGRRCLTHVYSAVRQFGCFEWRTVSYGPALVPVLITC